MSQINCLCLAVVESTALDYVRYSPDIDSFAPKQLNSKRLITIHVAGSCPHFLIYRGQVVFVAAVTNISYCSDSLSSCGAIDYTNDTIFLLSICTSAGEARRWYQCTLLIIPDEVVAALRVHAVSGGNRWLVVPTLALGMVPVGTNVVRVFLCVAGCHRSAE